MFENHLVRTMYPTVSMCFKKCRLYVLNYLGIILNVIWHLYKFYRQIKIDEKADKMNGINEAPLERRCVGCAKKFEPEHVDQIFCESACKDLYMNQLGSRTPFKTTANNGKK